MSKYTTEVRYICESLAGLDSSVGCDDIQQVIANSWDKIFDRDITFFDPAYKQVICSKILEHYYTCEIGAETFGLWKFWMNVRLNEIMPKYNQLYESAEWEYNPLDDVNYREQRTGSGSGTNTTNEQSSTQNQGTGSSTDRYSDTPQGGLSGIENDRYLTDARIINNTSSDSGSGSRTVSGTVSSTDQYVLTKTGKQGTASYTALIKEWRDALINIDLMLIDEFKDLFMMLW